MLRWPREGRLWLLLSALAVLLGMLAVLQYRWVGEIGRAERDRLRAALDSSARGLASDIERVAASAVMVLVVPSGDAVADPVATCSQSLAAWRQRSAHPGMVSRVTLIARAAPHGISVATGRTQDDTCQPTSVPTDLEPVVARLEELPGDRPPGPRGRRDFILSDPPALLLPLLARDGDTPRAARPGFGPVRLDGFLVVTLDTDYLHDELLPRMTESRFGPPETSTASVALVHTSDGSVLYTNDPDARLSDRSRGDLRLPLGARPGLLEGWERRGAPGGPDGPRPELRPGPPESFPVGEPRAEPPPPPDAPPRPRFDRRPGPMEPGWPGLELVVRPRAGSLDQAVTALRWRNLGISLGVLGLLGTAGVLLAAGAQKARSLARQQLEFVAGVTHELHTPLAAIRSAGQNLADGIVVDPEQVRRYGALLGKESARLGELVAQVLDFAGIESGGRPLALAAVAVGPLVDEVVRDLSLVLEREGLVARTQVEEGLPEVQADATALRRALGNLLTNTAKFAAEGGEVVVGARSSASRRGIEVFVEDRGPGIPRSDRERVFEPFVRGAAARSGQVAGSGLGLSFVRHVAEAHGGRARVDGRPGGGTVVVMEIPIGSSPAGGIR